MNYKTSNNAHCRTIHSVAVLALLTAALRAFCGQTTNSQLDIFQKFVNGMVPVREAVVYRIIAGKDGTMVNQDWWKFGLQGETWYVERLQPSTNDPEMLVPRPGSAVYGASVEDMWAVSDKDVHIAAKTVAANSLLDRNSAERNLMFSALSLGLPRMLDIRTLADAPIVWKGLQFHSTVAIKRSRTGAVVAKAVIRGELTVSTVGAVPESAEFQGSGEFPSGSIRYEYQQDFPSVPKIFIAKYGGREYRYKFLSLVLASNDAILSGGYTPSMFAKKEPVERHVTFWTNGKAYSLIRSNLVPAFGAYEAQKRHGGIFLALLAIISALFLALLWRSERRKNKQTQ